ncbi:MAG: hypothetical protein ACFFE3_12150, partial [Candidatus Thorarchaeota archaeon]
LRPRVTIDWLRKGRRVEDIKILRNLIDDSSDWKICTANLSETLFEKSFGLKPLLNAPQKNAIINDFLGQTAVSEYVRINKNDLLPNGETLLSQVQSLLPANLHSEKKRTLSYAFSRMIVEDTPSDITWPVVPIGLDSISAALFTINMISQLIGEKPRWLLPIWSQKVSEFKIEMLRLILDFEQYEETSKKGEIIDRLTSYRELVQISTVASEEFEEIDDEIDLEGIVNECKNCIETLLRMDSILSRQDPLSAKLEKWRTTFRDLEAELESASKDLSRKRKKKSPTGVEAAETRVLTLQEKIRDNNKALEDEIHSLRTQNQQLTEWTNQTLHPDGISSSKHDFLIKNIRADLNILSYPPLVKMCSFLSNTERPGRPAASDIVKELDLKQRMAHYSLLRLGLLMNERYILNPRKLGLKYRHILTKKQKPGVLSDGLIERMILNTSDEYSGCTVHLEPTSSRGQPITLLPRDTIQLSTDSEIISLRMDLFNTKERKWDLDSAYKNDPLKESSARRRTSQWLFRTTDSPSSKPVHLTPTELDILGPISVFRGLRRSRKWLFENLGINALTARRYVKSLVRRKILRLLYMPNIEYCGLPVGLLVGGNFKSEKSRKMLINWMVSRLPYARILTDSSTQLVALLRVPIDAVTPLKGILDSKSFASETSQWFVSGIMSYRTYNLTAFHKLTLENDGWSDPWI